MPPIRTLTASSYTLLNKLQCPMVIVTMEKPSMQDMIDAAVMWHFIHTHPVDDLDAIFEDVDALRAAIKKHERVFPLEELGPMLRRMKTELHRMMAALVEVESEGGSPLD